MHVWFYDYNNNLTFTMTMTTIITAMTTAIARLGPSTPPTIAVSVLDRPAAVPVTVYRDYMKRHTYVLYGGYFRGCYIIVLGDQWTIGIGLCHQKPL